MLYWYWWYLLTHDPNVKTLRMRLSAPNIWKYQQANMKFENETDKYLIIKYLDTGLNFIYGFREVFPN